MQNDPLLALEQESRKLDRAFDRAMARSNVDEVMRSIMRGRRSNGCGRLSNP